jgi:uncharacterized protein
MTAKRCKGALILLAGLVAGCMLVALPPPAPAQFFDNFLGSPSRVDRAVGFIPSIPFFGQPHARPRAQVRPALLALADYSHPPPPPTAHKNVPPNVTSIVVLGDSMADWLAYGLEQVFAEAPEISVTRKARPLSSLIYDTGRHDPAGKINWPATARDILAKEPASFVVMIIGLADRDPIHVSVPPRPAPIPGAKPGPPEPNQVGQPGVASTNQAAKAPQTGGIADMSKAAQGAAEPRATTVTYDFRTQKWAEFYGQRIDETIEALKSKGVPVFWVGLPPLLGARSTADMQYLNDLYRSRAEKAGITYIDVWDDFSDDGGQFTMQGPDYEGQIRRLRTPDGVYFTPAGARKLAHFVAREIKRALTPTGPMVPLPREPLLQAPIASKSPGGGTPRPLAGPVIPLNARIEPPKSDGLLGEATPKQTVADAVANRVLVNGDTMPAPAGRADDFVWPRRAPAPVGADPAVATTNLPMTPMVASNGVQQTEVESAKRAARSSPAPARTAWAHARVAQAHVVRQRPRPTHHYQYAQHQYAQYRQQSSFFFFFGH